MIDKILKLVIAVWACSLLTLIVVGGFKYGTARWLWRPLKESGTRTYIERGVIIHEHYEIIIN